MGVVGMGCGRRWGGGVCCLLEVPEGCSCQVNILQCTLEGVKNVVGKYIRWKSVPLELVIFLTCCDCLPL